MRRRPHQLQVSTFPFLAVLLCAMGALILVLLVMDRRSKLAAKQRGMEEAARIAQEQWDAYKREEERRRAAHEDRLRQAQADWEKKSGEEHARLTAEEKAIRDEQESVKRQFDEALARWRAEQEKGEAFRKQAATEAQRLEQAKADIARLHADAAKDAATTKEKQAELAKLTADLRLLEKTLSDLKAARERDRNTYSIVPYLGKRGEARRPLYVECNGRGVVFHPEKVEMDLADDGKQARAELERRAARQKEVYASASEKATPYLMLLVRPDGVENYWRFQRGIRDLGVEFGYEFVEADWVLEVPSDDSRKAPSTQIAGRPAPVPDKGPMPAPPSGGAIGRPQPSRPGDKVASAAGGIGSPLTPETPHGIMPTPGAPGTETGPGSQGVKPFPGGISLPGAVGVPGDTGTGTGTGVGTGTGTGTGTGASPPPFVAVAPPAGGGTGAGLPGVIARSPGGPEGPSAETPGDSEFASGRGSAPGGASTPKGPGSGAGTDDTRSGPPGASATPPPEGTKPPDKPATIPPLPTEKKPGATQPPPDSTPGRGRSGGTGGEGPADPVPRVGPRMPLDAEKPEKSDRPKPMMRPAKIDGSRDYVVFVECRDSRVVVYPSRLEFTPDKLAGRDNPVARAIKLLIDRRQAQVVAGETPYRPEVRFLVWPDGLQTFHRGVTAMEGLGVAMTRQNLEPEDDVQEFISAR